MFGMGGAHAQSTSYVYDANGRVVAVTASNGTSVQYSYNTLGHTSQISAPLSPGQLAIFAFVPTHGEAGTQVTIQGQGFDSNAANDTVSFNGTVATVLSASATQLVTTVPDGATTGPISVTVGGQTAASATPFVVDDTGIPPTITQVSPVVASVGTAMTVTGSHLDPIAGYTTVQMGGRDVLSLSQLSDTQLQYTVPSDVTTGYVTVETPYGLATSSTPVVVLPNGISASSVASSGAATVNGSSVNLNIGAGQYGAVVFAAPQSSWVSLQASGMTTSANSISYTVYGPGNSVVQQGSISSSAPSIHLPHLVGGAIYLVLIQPSGGSAQMAVGVEANALLTTNTAATVVTTVAGQSKRVLFNATAGQNLAFQINSTTTNPSGAVVTYTVYTPSGGSYTSATTASTGVINLGNLPTAGTYQVVIAPGSGVTEAIQVEVTPGVTGVLTATPQHYSANVSGQNIYLSFTATQGENLELVLYNVKVNNPWNDFLVYVYNAQGNQITSFWCNMGNPGASCNQHLWYLVAGQYSVVAVPADGGAISFDAILQDDIVGPNVPVNGTSSITLATGQVERLTFTANAGDTVALQVSGVTTSPSGQPMAFQVYRPDSGAITTGTPVYTSFAPNGSQVVNLANLPVSGTYTVIAIPYYGLAGSAQLSIVGGVTGTVPTDGTSQSYAANVAGQNVYLSFNATQGENLELVLNNVKVANPWNDFLVQIYNAQGGQVGNFWCSANNPGTSCNWHLWYLAAGRYSIVVVPSDGGSPSFNVSLQDDIAGPAITANSPVNIALGAGQVERYTFNASAGDTVALNVSGVTTTPSGQGVTFYVYRPDAGAITTGTPTYTTFGPSSSQTVNLPNLPVSGAYTVIVAPNYGLAGNAQLNVVSGVTGAIPTNGTSQSYAGNVVGQNIYLSFTATQGENLELVLNNVKVVNPWNDFLVQIYNAQGGQITSFWCSANNPGASCNQHLWYLAAGKYSIVVAPSDGGVPSFNVSLQDDIVGSAIAINSPINVALSAGQVERYTFNANAGDTLVLNVSGVSTTPSGQGVTFYVYRPDSGAITTGTPTYTTLAPNSAQTVNLPNLPVSGTYTVIVSPNYGLAGSAQLSILGGITGTLSAGAAAQGYGMSVLGQNVYLSFSATQGENLELVFNNGKANNPWNDFLVYVYNAQGAQVTSFWCSMNNPGASCNQHLWYLAAGKYSVIAVPADGGTFNFNVLLQDDVIGPQVTVGDSATLSLGAGQVERLTFNANAGDTVALQATGIVTTPAGQPVAFQVYRPDTGAITAGTPAYSSFNPSSNQTLNLQNLPVSGTYTVIAIPYYGLPASAAISLVSDTAGSPPTYGNPTLSAGSAPQSEMASSAGSNVTMSFNANLGDNLELTLSSISVPGSANRNGLELYVYDPNGNQVSDNYCYGDNPGASCRIALWNLVAGTYSVKAVPDWGGTISFNAQVQPDTVEAGMSPNTPASISLAQGQVQRLTFNANVGDTVALNLSGVSTAPAGQNVYVNVYRPDGGAITTSNAYTSFSTSGSTLVNLPNLPASGNYTAVVYTAYGQPGNAQLTVVPGATGTIPPDGTAPSYAANIASQNIYLNFNANLGDNLELTLSNIRVLGSSNRNGLELYVYGPSGNQVSDSYCYGDNPGSVCRIALWNMTAGQYSVVAIPDWGGTISFNAQVQADTQGAAMALNTPAAISLGQGQIQRLTFNANVGDTVALILSGVSTTPAGQNVYVNLYRPDTGAITTGNAFTSFSTSGSTVVNLQNLPASGTYTAVVYTAYGESGSAQLTVVPGATGNIPSGGTVQSYSANTANQNVYLNFNANLGDNLELTLSNITVPGGVNRNGLELYVYGPSGNQVSDSYCYGDDPGSVCRIALWNLAAGQYSVVAVPDWGGTISFNAQVQPDVQGAAMSIGTPATVSLAQGQLQRLTFNANVGDTIALNLSGVSTTPAGQNVYVNLYRPDTGAITTGNAFTSFSTSSSTLINLQNLPASGTYTAVVYTAYGEPGNAQLTVVPGTAGSVPSDGTVQSYTANVGGQNVYLSFNANWNDNLELTLSNISVPGSTNRNGLELYVYGPSGNQVADNYCYGDNPGSTCRIALWNLAKGAYSVVAVPDWGGTINFNTQLQADTQSGAMSANVPVNINVRLGQIQRFTFDANLGQTVALNLYGVSSTSPAGQAVYVYIYRPDTGAVTTGNYYAQFNTTSSSTLTLQSLPVSGTYTAVVFTPYGTPATAQMYFSPQ